MNVLRCLIALLALALAACDAPPKPLPGAAIEGRTLTDGDVTWTLSTEGVYLHNARSAQRRAVALPGWHWAGEPFACQPDLALGPRGELVVTSNILPTLWRVDPRTHAVTVHALELDADQHKDVGFAGLVYSVPSRAFFAVSQLHGSLWMIDPSLQRGRKIALEDLDDSSAEVLAAYFRAACATTAPRN